MNNIGRLFGLLVVCLYITPDSLAQRQEIYRLRNTGETFYYKSQYDSAKRYYTKAYKLSLLQHQTDIAVNLLVDISSVELLAGNYKKCVSLCLGGLELKKHSENIQDSTLFKIHSSLGACYQQMDFFDSSAYYFSQADQILLLHPQLSQIIPDYVMYHYSNQALLHEAIGRYSISLSLSVKALNMARRRHLNDDVAILCNVVAGQYERIGEYAKAMDFRLEGLTNNRSWDLQRARIYTGIGRNAFFQKEYYKSIQFLLKADQLYKRLIPRDSSQTDTRTIANLYNHLAQSYVAIHQYPKAEYWLNKAIRIYRLKYGPRGGIISTSLLTKGMIKEAHGQLTLALKDGRQALATIIRSGKQIRSNYYPDASDVLDEKAAIRILTNEGNLFSKLGNWQKALAAYRSAIAVFQQAQKHIKLLDDKLYATETIRPLYRYALEVAYQHYYHYRTKEAYETAFQILEQSRSITLQSVLTETLLYPKYIPDNQRIQELKMRQEIAGIHARWFSNPSAQKQLQLTAQEEKIKLEHYQLINQWERSYPAYYQTQYSDQSVSIRSVQNDLPKGSAYINFHYQQKKLHIFVITQSTTVWKTIAIDSTLLFQTIGTLQQLIKQHPGLGQYKGTPYALKCFDWFIEPISAYISGNQHWIINAGSELESLPIDVLETGQKVGDYVGLTHTIRYVYTAKSLKPIAQKPVSQTERILAVAPFGRAINPAINKRFRYPILPASQEENKYIDAHWLINEQATRTAFLKESGRFSAWYLATHAYLDEVSPMRSFIAFFPADTSYEHRLYAEEISQMNLSHLTMVVISACESGSGKAHPEGIMSLARTFAYAGCPATISTLWTAHDNTSAFLLKRFHAYIKMGETPASALLKARIDFFSNDETRAYNHPFFWANFRLIGTDSAIFSSETMFSGTISSFHLFLLIILVSILLVLGSYFHLRS